MRTSSDCLLKRMLFYFNEKNLFLGEMEGGLSSTGGTGCALDKSHCFNPVQISSTVRNVGF